VIYIYNKIKIATSWTLSATLSPNSTDSNTGGTGVIAPDTGINDICIY